MERLLTRTETDTHIIYKIGCGRFRFDKRETSVLRRVFDRLAAYEDTGMEPEEIITGEELAEIASTLLQLLQYQALGTIEELSALVKARDEGPCGLCRYNPPSSCDGKPCTMCPAEAAIGGGGDG